MTPATQNLNAKLSPRRQPGRATKRAGIDWRSGPIRTSAAPTRIVGTTPRYRGGYLVSR